MKDRTEILMDLMVSEYTKRIEDLETRLEVAEEMVKNLERQVEWRDKLIDAQEKMIK